MRSLKTQIVFAIGLLTTLFAASTLYSLHVIDQQHSDDVLVQLASQVKLHQQHLTVQAMRYKENAPRDYPSYYRDLRLYFVDLEKTRAQLTALIDAFAANDFDPELTGERLVVTPDLPRRSAEAADRLAQTWHAFLGALDDKIGPDRSEPRLEWAAELIAERDAALQQAVDQLNATLAADVAARASQANIVNRLLLTAALLVSLGTGIWFYRRVLRPLEVSVTAFREVANGDFTQRVPIDRENEIGSLADSFNRLSDRMEALRGLLTRLEQGTDLEATLQTLSESLPTFMPVDWIGVLAVGADGRIHLERAYSDGAPDTLGKLSFDPDRTLLAECIDNRAPLHIADVRQVSALSDRYVFLRQLADLGRRDAIFLPIGTPQQVQGVVVFANRYPNSYRTDHLALLRNLGVLLGVTLGRTLQLVENQRLASIGQFASGIAHEIRNPLATINLALEHLAGVTELPPGAAQRVELASSEVARLERLLADILLYARPLTLNRTPVDLGGMLRESASRWPERIALNVDGEAITADIDPDRMRQVLINLLQNAVQAAPASEPVRVEVRVAGRHWIEIDIANGGEPIPPRVLERLFEPFVTTKRDGTGLGLAIVRRIVAAHGGDIRVASDALDGTRVLVRIPAVAG